MKNVSFPLINQTQLEDTFYIAQRVARESEANQRRPMCAEIVYVFMSGQILHPPGWYSHQL